MNDLKNEKQFRIITWVVVVVILLGAGWFMAGARNASQAEVDSFATCLADSGAQFYGAHWCSSCQSQKELFNNSSELPYIECSSADGKSQLAVCAEAGIGGYPTWRFANGEEMTGRLSFDTLAEKTGCEAP